MIAGHLTDFPLAELLFFLSNKGRSGWLTLKNESLTIVFTLRSGRVVAAQTSHIDSRLGARLIAANYMSQTRLDHALAVQREMEEPIPLGAVLVNLGYVQPSAIAATLREQVAECIFQLLISQAGMFRFNGGVPDLRGVHADVSMEREVLNAIHRADEWTTDYIRSGKFAVPERVSADALEKLEAVDWPIVDALRAGAASLDEIVAATGESLEATTRHLLRLAAHGMVYPAANGHHRMPRVSEDVPAD